ncbi:MAG TPA: hypothetical protein PKJ19_02955 [Flavobacteriales bacterium]|nr:hypothetical protein [Flavobacteriales bacterium]HNU56759.1 hypothetical protein [Flavobacteriales bacterium]
MRVLLLLLLVPPLQVAAQKGFIHKGEREGVEMAYRWNHPVGKPSELILKLKNTTQEDRHVSLVIDLYYQGLTVEVLEADTCIKAGRTLNGKLNGIYFIPQRLSSEQIKSGDAEAELTRSEVTPETCP